MSGVSGESRRADRKRAELLEVIHRTIATHPRSQQRKIGPSEVGTACDRKLALSLWAMHENLPVEVGDGKGSWYPTIGTAVHSWLEAAFEKEDDYATEARVVVGTYDGYELSGSSDLFDELDGDVIDWKVVGENTLKKARAGDVAGNYKIQLQLYGKGQENAGHDVRHITIVFLPREEGDLEGPEIDDDEDFDPAAKRGAVVYTEPYDPSVAEAQLARLDRLSKLARTEDGVASTDVADECYFCPWRVSGRERDVTTQCFGAKRERALLKMPTVPARTSEPIERESASDFLGLAG